LATELDLIQTVNAGCDAVAPLHPGYRPADWLGEDQQRAIYHVLRTVTASPPAGLAGTANYGAARTGRRLQASRVEPLILRANGGGTKC